MVPVSGARAVRAAEAGKTKGEKIYVLYIYLLADALWVLDGISGASYPAQGLDRHGITQLKDHNGSKRRRRWLRWRVALTGSPTGVGCDPEL